MFWTGNYCHLSSPQTVHNIAKLRNQTEKIDKIFLINPSLSSICFSLSLALSLSLSLYVFPSSCRNFYSLILYTNLAVFTHYSYLLNLRSYSIFNHRVCHHTLYLLTLNTVIIFWMLIPVVATVPPS